MNVRMCFLAQYVLLSPLHDNFNRALAPRRFALLENVAFLLSKKMRHVMDYVVEDQVS